MASTSEPSQATPTSALNKTGNEALDRDVERLAGLGYQIEVLCDGLQVGVVVCGYPLSKGAYSAGQTDILLRTDLAYPQSAMDMLWVDQDLTLANGSIPAGGESLEVLFGRTWRRLSWHRNLPWKPGRDELVGHFEFCVARLQRSE